LPWQGPQIEEEPQSQSLPYTEGILSHFWPNNHPQYTMWKDFQFFIHCKHAWRGHLRSGCQEVGFQVLPRSKAYIKAGISPEWQLHEIMTIISQSLARIFFCGILALRSNWAAKEEYTLQENQTSNHHILHPYPIWFAHTKITQFGSRNEQNIGNCLVISTSSVMGGSTMVEVKLTSPKVKPRK
jgi:hypothetical protein